jgi:1,4-dihydroxy-2-naphthoyl-CoA hydrolase
MQLFRPDITPEKLNNLSANTMVEHLGIVFTEVGEDYIKGRMPVDHRTHQPYGILHGGASVALAETLGSVAAHCTVMHQNRFCVGLEINANHIRPVKEGFVTGTARPIHIGKRTQIWEVRLTTETGELVCISRITLAILDEKP